MKRQSRPKIGQRDRWNKWEEFCLKSLRLALKRLRRKAALPEGENALNSRLFDELRLAARDLCPKGFSYPPIRSECQVQPYGVSDESHRRLKATPDITWGYEDNRQSDPLKATRDFVIECKRVRTPMQSGWVFTTHYVEDGIKRFLDPTKRYAEGVGSAAMVGYWQDSAGHALHAQIRAAAQNAGITAVAETLPTWRSRAISEHSHVFSRPFEVSPIRLNHLWIDLRS